jgi:hypothetical protein
MAFGRLIESLRRGKPDGNRGDATQQDEGSSEETVLRPAYVVDLNSRDGFQRLTEACRGIEVGESRDFPLDVNSKLAVTIAPLHLGNTYPEQFFTATVIPGPRIVVTRYR